MDEEDEICFYDPSTYPTESTALDYFKNSPFYDKTSNNEILNMQMQYTTLDKSEIEEKLKQMMGIEYKFKESINNIFIIEKVYRKSYNITELRDIYYIMNGVIYKAPSDKKLLTSRFINSAYFIDKALDIYLSKVVLFEQEEFKENDEEFNKIVKIINEYNLR